MDVSIVITTKNEEKHIGNCLKAVAAQRWAREQMEIIVVDNGSADATKKIASRYADNVYNMGGERSTQRNFGIDRATGKYVLFLDADMVLSEQIIAECVQKCENEGFIALYIPEKITGRGFWIKVRDFERSFYNATVIDCVRFVRRDKFLEAGGFDEHLIGPEDWDFDRRIRKLGKIGEIQTPLYHNEGKFDFERYLEKKNYYSKTFIKYIEKWGRNDEIIKKQLGFAYRYWGVFTEKGKFKRLLAHPGLALGMYFLKVLVGLQYVKYQWTVKRAS
ncbi:MAG: glycosyltransferase [Candidatus Omnitrophota bacterium]